MHDRIWITWETQRRNRTLSAALGAELHELDYRLPRMRRWATCIGQSLRILYRQRPQLLFAQNPSLVLALTAVWYGKLCRRPVVIDAHNGGVFPFAGRHGLPQRLLRGLLTKLANHVMRQADVTLVSNPALARHVDAIGGKGFALPDPLPVFDDTPPARLSGSSNVLFICTWAGDEPYLEVIKAARQLPASTRIYITGNSTGRERVLGGPLPENVELTGFVSEERFLELLRSADVIMDLTTLEDCLVCGAYEAVAMGKPMVLSESRALRTYFHKGAVFTRNDADSIAEAVSAALADQARLEAQTQELRAELRASWRQRREELETLLSAQAPLSASEQPATRPRS